MASQDLELSPLGFSAPSDAKRHKSLRDLARLMDEIKTARADIDNQRTLYETAQRRLAAEHLPIRIAVLKIRLEYFNALGRTLVSDRLKVKQKKILGDALKAMAKSLIEDFDLNLDSECEQFFGDQFLFEEGDSESDELDAFFERISSQEEYFKASPDPNPEDKEAEFSKPNFEDEFKSRPHQKKGKQAKQEQSLLSDIRALYLMLARALHPDKESESTRRAEKTVWMQKVTDAYGRRNLSDLLDIMTHNPLDAIGPYLSSTPETALKGFTKRLQRELTGLRKENPFLQDSVMKAFVQNGKLFEPAYKQLTNEGKKAVKQYRSRRDYYSTQEGVIGLIAALKELEWHELL